MEDDDFPSNQAEQENGRVLVRYHLVGNSRTKKAVDLCKIQLSDRRVARNLRHVGMRDGLRRILIKIMKKDGHYYGFMRRLERFRDLLTGLWAFMERHDEQGLANEAAAQFSANIRDCKYMSFALGV